MKRLILLTMSLFALVIALAACAGKVSWLELWSTPMPGRTSSIVVTPVSSAMPDATSTIGVDELFATDVVKMDNPKIVVYKSKHMLEVWDGDKLMARMQIAIGRGLVGPKLKNGDNKTPEGEYYICKTSDTGKFYKSLFLSYPNTEDANVGLSSGIIKQSQYDTIAGDIENRKQPAWDTGLGGEIAINGTGTGGAGKTGDWTAGNIAVSDKDMDYLCKHIKIDVDVVINP